MLPSIGHLPSKLEHGPIKSVVRTWSKHSNKSMSVRYLIGDRAVPHPNQWLDFPSTGMTELAQFWSNALIRHGQPEKVISCLHLEPF